MGTKSKTKTKTTINMPSTKKTKKSTKSTSSLQITIAILTTLSASAFLYFNLSNPAIFRAKRETTPEKNDHIRYTPGVKDGSGYHFNMPKNPSSFEKVSKTDAIEQQKLLIERSSGVVEREASSVFVKDADEVSFSA